jgi:cytochrome c oxidase cbb3-type subunit IV
MFKNILNSMDGISIYGIISICIFFSFFTGMLIWACLLKKNYLHHMSEVPLNSGEKNSTDKLNAEKL